MLFQHQPVIVEVGFFWWGVVGDSGLPGNFEVIPIAYAMVETVSLITAISTRSTSQ